MQTTEIFDIAEMVSRVPEHTQRKLLEIFNKLEHVKRAANSTENYHKDGCVFTLNGNKYQIISYDYTNFETLILRLVDNELYYLKHCEIPNKLLRSDVPDFVLNQIRDMHVISEAWHWMNHYGIKQIGEEFFIARRKLNEINV